MTTAELDARALELRAEGLTFQEVGDRMGESTQQAWKRCHRDKIHAENLARSAAKRANERELASDCVDCGVRLSCPRSRRCADCATDAAQREAKERTERFAAMRGEGLLNYEIAEREGVSTTVVASCLHRAYRYGVEVPTTPYGPAAARMAA